jgi:hypothetical protein
MDYIQNIMEFNSALSVQFLPRGGQYFNDASAADIDAVLQYPRFAKLRGWLGGRLIVLQDGPRASGMPLKELSADLLQAVHDADEMLVIGSTNFEMMNGIRRNGFYIFDGLPPVTTTVTGLPRSASAFVYVPKGVVAYAGYTERLGLNIKYNDGTTQPVARRPLLLQVNDVPGNEIRDDLAAWTFLETERPAAEGSDFDFSEPDTAIPVLEAALAGLARSFPVTTTAVHVRADGMAFDQLGTVLDFVGTWAAGWSFTVIRKVDEIRVELSERTRRRFYAESLGSDSGNAAEISRQVMASDSAGNWTVARKDGRLVADAVVPSSWKPEMPPVLLIEDLPSSSEHKLRQGLDDLVTAYLVAAAGA